MGWREHRSAPAAGTSLCAIDAIPDGGCKELRYGPGDDAFALLMYRRESEVRAYVNKCPHFSLPLNSRPDTFLLLRDSQIMCAYHSAVFRLEDGLCIAGPAHGMGLERVPVRLVERQIYLGEP
jgi:nitrite reductase/ring-hydroxylating ferredoxin subunit